MSRLSLSSEDSETLDFEMPFEGSTGLFVQNWHGQHHSVRLVAKKLAIYLKRMQFMS
jgi:hypothetical protein